MRRKPDSTEPQSPRLFRRGDARWYLGGMGEEAFGREVAPFLTPVLIGQRVYYDRLELDAWVDGKKGGRQTARGRDYWLGKLSDGLAEDQRR